MSKSLKRVKAALRDAGLNIEPMEMPNETRTAQQAADAAGCALDQIAKSVILQDGETGTCYLFLTAGGNQVDAVRASDTAGTQLSKADAAAIRAHTGFAIGGVSPLGHLNPITAYMDPRLMDFDVIYAAAGTPRHIFPINPSKLADIIDAEVRVFTEPR